MQHPQLQSRRSPAEVPLSHTNSYLCLPFSHKHVLFWHSFLLSLHPFPAGSITFLLCFFFLLQQYCLFARGGADRRCLAASRPGPPCVCSDVRLVLSAIGLCLFWADNVLFLHNQLLLDTSEEKGELLSSHRLPDSRPEVEKIGAKKNWLQPQAPLPIDGYF